MAVLLGTDAGDSFAPLTGDTVIGGNGDDTYAFTGAIDAVIVEEAGGGTDTVTVDGDADLPAFVENLIFRGTNGLLRGNPLPNRISVEIFGSNDSLDGGAGADTLSGGGSNDTYFVDSPLDVVIEVTSVGPGSSDVVHVVGVGVFTLAENVEIGRIGRFQTDFSDGLVTLLGNGLSNSLVGNRSANVLSGLGGNDTIDGGAGDDTLLGGVGDDSLRGGADADRIDGGAGSDRLEGEEGSDTLLGGLGTDSLDGGEGNDRLEGGAGDDTYLVDTRFDRVVELANGGIDLVRVDQLAAYLLPENVENAVLLPGWISAAFTGNGLANALYGGDLDDTLAGEGGNDRLVGGSGDDVMRGGIGNDTYLVDSSFDVVTELSGAGIDLVILSDVVSYTLPDNVEHLRLTGGDPSTGRGNALDNRLTAGSGDARLFGFAGNDTLEGSVASNVLVGGAGNDLYIVTNPGSVIVEGGDEGLADEVRFTGFLSVDDVFRLAANVERLVLTAGVAAVGNGAANVIEGNTLDNRLDGGGGADTLRGGAGNDTYFVDDAGDRVTELSGGGLDTIRSRVSFSLALTAEVENLVLLGSVTSGGTGNGKDNRITGNAASNVLSGGAGNDVLEGAGGTDTLDGGVGNDLLDGGRGNDFMTGGAGNDSYVVDAAGDIVTELARGGTDQITSTVTYSLDVSATQVEFLFLAGAGDIDGSGNALANRLYGNSRSNALYGLSGNDLLDGRGGADLMSGGIGDDTFVVDAGDGARNGVADNVEDVLIETFSGAFGGRDLVLVSTFIFALPDNVEDLRFLRNAGTDVGGAAIGNVLRNVLTGTAFADRLDGGEGTDTLAGEGGDDTFVVDAAGDVIIERPGGGDDAVEIVSNAAGANYVLAPQVERVRWADGATGTALRFTGNELDNVMVSSEGADTLDGGAGNDRLSGAGGADSLVGGLGNDSLTGGSGPDVMVGGAGNDTYAVDAAQYVGASLDAANSDRVVERAGEGNDRVVYYGLDRYVLPADVEDLETFVGGDQVMTLEGNSGDNRIFADSFRMTGGGIDAGPGNDWVTAFIDTGALVLAGGLGRDRLELVGSGTSAATFSGFEEVVVNDGLSFSNVFSGTETLVLVGDFDRSVAIAPAGPSSSAMKVVLQGADTGATTTLQLVPNGVDDAVTFALRASDGANALVASGLERLNIESLAGPVSNLRNVLDLAGVTGLLDGPAGLTVKGAAPLSLGGLGSDVTVSVGDFSGESLRLVASDPAALGNNAYTVVLRGFGGVLDFGLGSGADTVTLRSGTDAGSSVRMSGLDAASTLRIGGSADLVVRDVQSGRVDVLATGRAEVLADPNAGGIIFDVQAASEVRLAGGGGDDSFALGATLDARDVILGGGGQDTVSANITGLDVAGSGALRLGNADNPLTQLTFTVDAAAGVTALDASRIWSAAGQVTGGTADSVLELRNVSGTTWNLDGFAGDATVTGTNMTVRAGSGNDTLTVLGGSGSLAGGLGNDTLTGGADADTFVFDTAPDSGTNMDVIVGLSGFDVLVFDNDAFAALGAEGVLDPSLIAFGDGSGLTTQRLLFVTEGNDPRFLLYDADGFGSGADPVRVAFFDGGGPLSAGLISIID